MRAGRLRHRIRIEQQVDGQDPATFEPTRNWATFADKVPASIIPLSGREFVAAGGKQAEVTTRIELRMLPGLVSTMRVVDIVTGAIYSIAAVLPDPTNARHQNIMASTGVSDGR